MQLTKTHSSSVETHPNHVDLNQVLSIPQTSGSQTHLSLYRLELFLRPVKLGIIQTLIILSASYPFDKRSLV